MRSLVALTLFTLTTLAAGCAPRETTSASPAVTAAPPAAPPATPERAPTDPLTGLPPEQLVKAYREGRLKLPEPPPLHTEKPNACRSPAEPGCTQCCNKSEPDGCHGGQGSAEPPGNGSPPWFNATGWVSDGPCPAGCKPCAQCTLHHEWELSKVPDPQCDCTQSYPGVDHCYSPTSCGCICERVRGLIDRCPHLHPARAR